MKTKLLLTLVMVALLGSLVSSACSTEGPIKIGALLALTGPMATDESASRDAIKMALDEVDYEVAGQEIQLIVEDWAMDPAVCLSKTKKLIEMDDVDIIIGPFSSSGGLAIRDYINENERLWIPYLCTSSAFIEDSYTRYFFRASYNSGRQLTSVGAYIAYETKGWRKAACIALDYQPGHDELEGFKEVFEALGGEVVQEIYTPMSALDYGPYVTQINVDDVDFLWSFHYAGYALSLFTALEEYGIKDQLPVFVSCNTFYPSLLAQTGDTALGIESVSNYITYLDTAENNRFVQELEDNYQAEATDFSEHAYVAAKMAILAIEGVDGDVDDVDGMIETLEQAEFEAPRGPIKFEVHSPVQNMYHTVVERVEGELQTTLIGTYTDIGPYWLPPGIELD